MFASVLRSLGTERLQKYVDASEKMEIFGAFGLTEVAHGTNALGCRTSATYDIASESFILHTPDFEAAKCWVGNLGKTCTHSIVYAQLYTPDGKNHGLNAFLVPIRDPKTMLAYSGVRVGDLGEKIGLNGIDNGFVLFEKYKIPRENLLSRTGDVTKDGKFESPFKDANKRMGASFGALSGGRVSICGIATTYLVKAITIAVRYSAARKQFGPENGPEELPVLEYQAQQYRLFPYLAAAYASVVFSHWFNKQYNEMLLKVRSGGQKGPNVGMEIHALSSAAKPFMAWQTRDAIQECREACGGHGYLKVAGIGDLRNNHDANSTYEGESNVLLQQASNWLLSVARRGFETFKSQSPLGSAAFLADTSEKKCESLSATGILDGLDWLVMYLLQKTGGKILDLVPDHSKFDIRNNIQVFNANTLAIVFAQRNVFKVFKDFVEALEATPEKAAVGELLQLYGLNLLIKNSGLLYQCGFFRGQDLERVENEILSLLPKIKVNAVALVDSIAYPDFILGSALGQSDGEIYKNLEAAIMKDPDVFERPHWWKDIVEKEEYLNAKL